LAAAAFPWRSRENLLGENTNTGVFLELFTALSMDHVVLDHNLGWGAILSDPAEGRSGLVTLDRVQANGNGVNGLNATVAVLPTSMATTRTTARSASSCTTFLGTSP
jgi:hypothetical protein